MELTGIRTDVVNPFIIDRRACSGGVRVGDPGPVNGNSGPLFGTDCYTTSINTDSSFACSQDEVTKTMPHFQPTADCSGKTGADWEGPLSV